MCQTGNFLFFCQILPEHLHFYARHGIIYHKHTEMKKDGTKQDMYRLKLLSLKGAVKLWELWIFSLSSKRKEKRQANRNG